MPDMPKKSLTGAQILKNYFGVQESYKGQSGLKGFAAELKALDPADKRELETLAAVELGVTVKVD